ncbi:MAG: general secretion pathway protein GspK [candidate division KSB1 bacterium]|nr:general secretion pathway protein GspK [candidate division KSB1 bacterium]MDZ7308718.1 general secretion pathway protein GspK [candidate division KSB1 bacterium]MDZ7351459.1 general secretion pathway protein GspK [candidate division KSB1 bacterium]MDZ7355818.1 general secretion pathway protein GspK [candidate division KSB1 bacterium]MDZ7384448.1 general secretion pathway protein GspK [candidate division KSB1 bacterium]
MASRFAQERGTLAVTALWMLALLTLLAAGLMRSTLLGVRSDTLEIRATQAAWLARAGVQHAIAILLQEARKDSSCDALSDAWAQNEALFKHVACGEGFFEIAHLPPEDSLGRKPVYGLVDENRKLNLNRMPADILLRLPGMNPEKVAALLDWRDADNLPHEGGAEDSYYMALASPYPCKDGDLDFVEELALVRGFTAEDVQRLSPLVTVYGDGRVNLNTAPAAVLEALGLPRELAQRIVKRRRGADGKPGTADDIIFKDASAIVSVLQQQEALTPADQMLVNRLVAEQLLGVSSTHFTISVVGVTMNGQARKRITATVQRVNRERVKILNWQEL